MTIIGIDPGVSTGFAVCDGGKYLEIKTLKIHKAMDRVLAYKLCRGLKVYIEDARKRGGISVRAQGAGSVKRDCKIWEDFLIDNDIEHYFVKPSSKLTKVPDERFKQLTGWRERTSNHARDAAMLIWGL